MYLANARGLFGLVRQKPQLAAVAKTNLQRRLTQSFQNNRITLNGHPPEMLTMFVTDRCNLKCRQCHYAHTDSPGYQLNHVGMMDPKIFRKVMEEIPEGPLVSITGGEPLLHPEITTLISEAKKRGRICSITTNGWLLERKAELLRDAGLDILIVSVDGLKDTHNRIRGERSFERLRDGLAAVLRLPNRPLTFVAIAISDMNYDKLIPVYEQALKWGVDGMNINHLWLQTDTMSEAYNQRFSIFPADQVAWDVQPERIDVTRLADDITTIRRRNWGARFLLSEAPYLNREEIAAWYQQPEQPVKYKTVCCGWTRLKVWADGKVKPCRGWVVGDVTQQHVMEIWNGRGYQDFRRTLAEHGMLPICTRCCWIAYR